MPPLPDDVTDERRAEEPEPTPDLEPVPVTEADVTSAGNAAVALNVVREDGDAEEGPPPDRH